MDFISFFVDFLCMLTLQSEKNTGISFVYPQFLHRLLCKLFLVGCVKGLKNKGFLLDLRRGILYNLYDIF